MRCRRLLNFDMARQAGGRFLLRIEDIDATRCRPEYEAAIYEDLAWLGLTWEEPVRRQSAHLDAYEAALGRLEAMGLIYPSFESRAEIARLVADRERAGPWPRDPDGVPFYPGDAKALPPGRAPAAPRMPAIRLRCASTWRPRRRWRRSRGGGPLTWTETGAGPGGETGTIVADPAAWGDVILARKDVPTSYHLSAVVDDAQQGITHVVRGQDLFHATGLHRLLQALLGLPVPVYHHHRLHPRRRGPQAVQIDPRDRPARAARRRRHAGRYPADDRAATTITPTLSSAWYRGRYTRTWCSPAGG